MDIIFFLAILTGILATLYFRLFVTTAESDLDALCSQVFRGFTRREQSSRYRIFAPRTYIFEGVYAGREVQFHFTYLLFGPHDRQELEIRLPVVQKFWLRMVLEPQNRAQSDEIEVGDKFFDGKFLIHSSHPEAASEYLRDPYVREHIVNCGPFFKIEFYRGALRVLYRGALRNTATADLQKFLTSLVPLAHAYERLSVLRMRAIAADSGTCAYCRAAIMEEGQTIATCSSCGTRLHDSCRAQNGQCTTWGCASTSFQSLQSEI